MDAIFDIINLYKQLIQEDIIIITKTTYPAFSHPETGKYYKCIPAVKAINKYMSNELMNNNDFKRNINDLQRYGIIVQGNVKKGFSISQTVDCHILEGYLQDVNDLSETAKKQLLSIFN